MVVARIALLVALGLIALLRAPAATADLQDEAALAERYAPVIRLVAQEEPCGHGESYEPMDVDLLFDEPTVALRGPWGRDLVEIAPSARDLADLYRYQLDFPGNALDPGCDYELWARRLAEGHAPAVYAHVASDPGYPGRLALQYWLFYAYNDWNNLHEGDWEMIQLLFDAGDAAGALLAEPTAVGYSQHEGTERADWGDDKLELVERTHPVVHPASGSHANFFGEALYLGSSAEQGVGCDDTRGPTYDLRPTVFTIPADPGDARAAFPWITFEGRWGEFQPAFFNGPTGPNMKRQWTEPIRWSEGWRDRSYAVPAGGAFGTGATDLFCGGLAVGSRGLHRFLDDPVTVAIVLTVLVALLMLIVRRTTWRPAAPLSVARRRGWGQILTAAAAMYRRRVGLFLGIGIVLLPITLLVGGLQALVLGSQSLLGIDADGEGGGLLVLVFGVVGTTLALLGVGLVQAATVRALAEIEGGRRVGPVSAYRLALETTRPLLGALVVAVVVVSVLASTLLLVPIAIWLAVRWALVVPVVELEGSSGSRALGRSARLVRRDWLKIGLLIIVGGALAFAAGPVAGALLILLTSAPFALVNVVAGFVYAVTMPFVALATAYAYFDARVREELGPDRDPETLPAEIGLPA